MTRRTRIWLAFTPALAILLIGLLTDIEGLSPVLVAGGAAGLLGLALEVVWNRRKRPGTKGPEA